MYVYSKNTYLHGGDQFAAVGLTDSSCGREYRRVGLQGFHCTVRGKLNKYLLSASSPVMYKHEVRQGKKYALTYVDTN